MTEADRLARWPDPFLVRVAGIDLDLL